MEKIDLYAGHGAAGGLKKIGTTAPSTTLDVVDTTGGGNGVTSTSYSSASSGSGGWAGRHARGTAAAPTAVQNGDRLSGMWGAGYNGTGWSANSAAIISYAAENYSTTNSGSLLTFETTRLASTTRYERMRIDPNGSVGIRPTCPTAEE